MSTDCGPPSDPSEQLKPSSLSFQSRAHMRSQGPPPMRPGRLSGPQVFSRMNEGQKKQLRDTIAESAIEARLAAIEAKLGEIYELFADRIADEEKA